MHFFAHHSNFFLDQIRSDHPNQRIQHPFSKAHTEALDQIRSDHPNQRIQRHFFRAPIKIFVSPDQIRSSKSADSASIFEGPNISLRSNQIRSSKSEDSASIFLRTIQNFFLTRSDQITQISGFSIHF